MKVARATVACCSSPILCTGSTAIERLQCIILPSNCGHFGAQPPIAIIHLGTRLLSL